MFATAPVDTNVDKVLQTLILHSAGDSEDIFIIVLRTDGTGILFDCSYGETIDIENHNIDLLDLESQHAITLTDVHEFVEHKYMYRYDVKDEAAIAKTFDHEHVLPQTTWDSIILERVITPLFEAHNEKLNNPVGDGPDDDEEMTVAVGTEHELLSTLYGISYLADMAGLESEFAFTTGTDEQAYDIHDCSRDLTPIVQAVLDVFLPNMTTWEYIDENDGRVTAYGPGGRWFDIAPSEIETYFPSARERLEIKSYLTEIFTKYGIEVGLIEATFNPLSD
jgi:hypothetical protein